MNTLLLRTLSLILIVSLSASFFVKAQTQVSYDDDSSQNYDLIIDIDQFDQQLIQKLVLLEINKHRKSSHIDELTPERILTLAAKDQAGTMAEDEIYKIEDPDETPSLVQEYGGTLHATEVTAKVSVKKSSEFLSYQNLATLVIEKWVSSNKFKYKIENPGYFFIGVGASLDEMGKKLYVSAIFGNYYTYNGDFEKLEDLKLPVTDKSFGLRPRDEKICGKAERYNLSILHDGLYVENNYVYLKVDNLKKFKKIIKSGSQDGLAIDMIQKEQYQCGSANIIDFELNNRGVLMKPVFADKIYQNNEYDYPESKTKLLVELAELPYNISHEYELNLVIIKDKHYCKDIHQSFLLDGGFKAFKGLHLLADTVTINSKTDFIPEAVDDEFMIRVPLTKGKNTFSYEDIKPYIDELNAPPFVINEVEIAAFSSLDESGNKNMIKNHKKAESILKALKEQQEENFKSDILASNSWTIFQNDVIGTEFEQIAFMGFEDALRYIRNNNLKDKLEPIFVNHRFAQIQLSVLYDLRGDKEQEYVLHHFNKAIEKSNLSDALSIQKYMFKMRMEGKYDDNSIIEQRIPLKSKFAGLLMNKLWLQNKYELIEEGILYKTLQELHKLAPGNPYIHFNLISEGIEYDEVGDDYKIYKTQSSIDKLYQSTIHKRTVDNLNLEYQFKVIAVLDTLSKPSPKLFESLNRIKTIFNLESASAKSSLQLAYLFISHEDYNFASRLLEIFIEDTNVDEELLFTYLSLCSVSDYKYFSTLFTTSLEKAAEINPDRFCKLFDGDHFSVRVLENPEAKKLFCKSCNK